MSLRLPPLFTTLQLPLIYMTNISTLAIGPRHRFLQFAFSVPVLFILAMQSVYREWTGGWGLHYGINCLVMTSIGTWVDWILLSSPDRERWVKLDPRRGVVEGKGKGSELVEKNGAFQTDGHTKSSGSACGSKENEDVLSTFWKRLWWAIRLATTNRYTGWSCEVRNVPVEVKPGYPRWQFLVRKTLRAGVLFLVKDVLASYTASTPHGTWVDLAHSDPPISFDAYPLWYRISFTWMFIMLTYVNMEWVNTIYSIVSVATGLAAPTDCPSLFGDLREGYSVRRGWSVVWHQQLRRVCSAPGIYLARDILQLRRGSVASKYLQVSIGFGISGVIHAAGSMLCHASFHDDGAMRVFACQAVLILIEDLVMNLGKKCGLKNTRFWRLIGFVWTLLAFGASLEGWIGSTFSHGIWVHDREFDFFGIGPK